MSKKELDTFIIWHDDEVGIVEFEDKLWATHYGCPRQAILDPGNYYQFINYETSSGKWRCAGCSLVTVRDGRGFPPDKEYIKLEYGLDHVRDWVHGWTGLNPLEVEVSIK